VLRNNKPIIATNTTVHTVAGVLYLFLGMITMFDFLTKTPQSAATLFFLVSAPVLALTAIFHAAVLSQAKMEPVDDEP